jgi:hypothetical protein
MLKPAFADCTPNGLPLSRERRESHVATSRNRRAALVGCNHP